VLIYNTDDVEVNKLGEKYKSTLNCKPYSTPQYTVTEDGIVLESGLNRYLLQIFGAHNLQNMMGAMALAKEIGISEENFLNAMQSFTGAGKRLQKVVEKADFVMFKDFAHSPSKLKATTKAVKERYPNRKVIACMELHTFSSLKKDFLPQYDNAMNAADTALVYFSPEVVAHKKLAPITKEDVFNGFGGNVNVLNETQEVLDFISKNDWHNTVLLMMSSGNFDGINYEALGEDIANKL
jgi:UDP-N-acetylmuramate: L-alanyl-gamma-D-glutamyl-meso-diaminopimelate ligase